MRVLKILLVVIVASGTWSCDRSRDHDPLGAWPGLSNDLRQPPPFLAQGNLSPQNPLLLVGEAVQLEFAAALGATNGPPAAAYSWTSGDPAVASVTASGVLTGVSPGTATVYATLGSNLISTTVTVVADRIQFSNRCLPDGSGRCASVTVGTSPRPGGGTTVHVRPANVGPGIGYLSSVQFSAPASIVLEGVTGRFAVPPRDDSKVGEPVTDYIIGGDGWLLTLVPGAFNLQSFIGTAADFGMPQGVTPYVGDGIWGCNLDGNPASISGYTTCGLLEPMVVSFGISNVVSASQLTFYSLGFWNVDGNGQLTFAACGPAFNPCVDN